jgi:hypothetical protein
MDILKLVDDLRYTPKQASQLLWNHKRKGNLFTSSRTCPQKYYLSIEDAEYAAQKEGKSTVVDPTGVPPSTTTSNATSVANANAIATTSSYNAIEGSSNSSSSTILYNCLLLFKAAPICIHNLHLTFTLLDNGVESYDLLANAISTANNAKTLTRNISKYRRINYNVYPSGKVELLVSCSKRPFAIQTDADVTALFGFLHQVQYILLLNLHDTTSNLYVPPVHTWRLTQADINKDIRCPNPLSMHYQEPKIQLHTLESTLRLYLKVIDGESYVRLEEMRVFNKAFDDAIASLRNNNNF